MRIWGTYVYAKCAVTGLMKTFCGPNISAPSKELAHEYCQNNGLGYCHVTDEIIMEIPCKKGTYEPDWDNAIDYEKPQKN